MTSPAEPVLASALWESQQLFKKSHDSPGPDTGLRALDEVLSQCLHYGTITCIHAETTSGEKELCNALLTSHLLRSLASTATVIDVSSFFDVRKIHQNIVSRIGEEARANDKAVQVLDRLNIMQIFDFEGLTDAILEVRQTLEESIASPHIPQSAPQVIKSTINDSQDEDETLDNPTPAPPILPSTHPTSHFPPRLLLLTNLHHIIHPLIKTNPTQGQSLLLSLLRSLHHLTQTHNLLTLILSGVASYPKAREEAPSAFASCLWRPVLGKAFSHTLDAEMLLYRAPGREGRDAGDGTSILEVLQDRNGKGVGRWAPFRVDKEGRLKEFG